MGVITTITSKFKETKIDNDDTPPSNTPTAKSEVLLVPANLDGAKTKTKSNKHHLKRIPLPAPRTLITRIKSAECCNRSAWLKLWGLLVLTLGLVALVFCGIGLLDHLISGYPKSTKGKGSSYSTPYGNDARDPPPAPATNNDGGSQSLNQDQTPEKLNAIEKPRPPTTFHVHLTTDTQGKVHMTRASDDHCLHVRDISRKKDTRVYHDLGHRLSAVVDKGHKRCFLFNQTNQMAVARCCSRYPWWLEKEMGLTNCTPPALLKTGSNWTRSVLKYVTDVSLSAIPNESRDIKNQCRGYDIYNVVAVNIIYTRRMRSTRTLKTEEPKNAISSAGLMRNSKMTLEYVFDQNAPTVAKLWMSDEQAPRP